ncbi:MAG: hypothetical protein AVDCRST_MAG96-2786 [uncultured Segetibacter sp.]|uniref:NIPSNAP domain-containing protein n=1 Tax=uncultured Segetibacter sp. TaxID=481133 RepID=A0A6J4TBF7_9BACT|nr:MAG: hypothetical protein AVDCRST_MAG96-2786 [uncultured Segetibacter sp.]
MQTKNSNLIWSVLLVVPALLFSLYVQAQSKHVKVIELRNYLLKPGQRDSFVDGFETKLLDTLNAHKNYILGQYRVKDAKDNFVWIRGFDDMPARKQALTNFYASRHWAKNKSIPEAYLIGYTNVHLLKPLLISSKKIDSSTHFDTEWFGRPKGVTIIDFFVANEMRNKLIDFVANKYDSVVRAAGVKDISYWVCETAPNNYPNLPAFQDKNLLVSISHYNDLADYHAAVKKIRESMNEEEKFTLGRLVTTRATWTLYPTERTFTSKRK